ncbi:MAG: N-acetylmuramoyl-L-alanine amidase [Hamadaea sp.]|nr:N-acetylmuramoyl-L-alanine amidase [Hamadaea sp.]
MQPPQRRFRLLASLSALTLVASGLAATPGAAAETTASTRQQVYTDAAAEYGVPADILLAVSYLESRWDVNGGLPSTSAGFGPMHLTDAAYVTSLPREVEATDAPAEDSRGDDSRTTVKAPIEQPAEAGADPAALQTLDAAAAATGLSKEELRTDVAANIRGGAALLSAYQRALNAPTGADSDVAEWYGAVARYSGATDDTAAAAFADEVYATLAEGAARTTDDGQALAMSARATTPNRQWLNGLGLRHLARPDGLECPVGLDCEWIPAPYQELPGNDYGNHDLGNRPAQQKIEYIVIHDTEGYYPGVINLVQDPTYVSWHYTLRSVDGHIAQHVKAKDVAWHAGNWYVNAKSIGLEHEGFAANGAWYTEAMYRTSSKLVRYLALRLGIPLDRQHIIGHDNVPGITPANVAGMHWDPGPYWDWAHYMELLKAPIHGIATPVGGMVTINPNYATNQPAFTGCVKKGVPCTPHGSGSVVLRTAPAAAAPLLTDFYLNGTKPATMHISDHGARVETGQQYAIADRQGDWVAIWYLGQKGWFYNPPSNPAAVWSTGFVVTPKAGKATIPVYGRAYPEAAAYPAGVPAQAIAPLTGYTLAAGQKYVVGNILPSEYYRAVTFDGSSPGDWTVIRGETTYVQIQFGHRIMFVNLADVDIRPAVL